MGLELWVWRSNAQWRRAVVRARLDHVLDRKQLPLQTKQRRLDDARESRRLTDEMSGSRPLGAADVIDEKGIKNVKIDYLIILARTHLARDDHSLVKPVTVLSIQRQDLSLDTKKNLNWMKSHHY